MTNDRRRVTDAIQQLLDAFCIRDIVSAVDPYAGRFHDLCLALAKQRGEELLQRLCSTIGTERLPALAACWSIAAKKIEAHVMLRLAITLGTTPEAEAGRPLLARPWRVVQPNVTESWPSKQSGALGAVVRWLTQPASSPIYSDSVCRDPSIKPGIRVRMHIYGAWTSEVTMTELMEAALEDRDASPLVRRRELVRALKSQNADSPLVPRLTGEELAQLSLRGKRLLTRFPDLWHLACDAPLEEWQTRVSGWHKSNVHSRHLRTIQRLCKAIREQNMTALRGPVASRGAYGKLWKAISESPDLAKELQSSVMSACKKMPHQSCGYGRWQHLREAEVARLAELLPMLPIPAYWSRSYTSLKYDAYGQKLEVTRSLVSVAHRMPTYVHSLILRSRYRNALPLDLPVWQQCNAKLLRIGMRTRPGRTKALLELVSKSKSLDAYADLFLHDAEQSKGKESQEEWYRVLPEPDRRRLVQSSMADAGSPRWMRVRNLGLLDDVDLSMLAAARHTYGCGRTPPTWARHIARLAPQLSRTPESIRQFFAAHSECIRPLAASLTLDEWAAITAGGELKKECLATIRGLLPKLDPIIASLLRERLGAQFAQTTPKARSSARPKRQSNWASLLGATYPPTHTQILNQLLGATAAATSSASPPQPTTPNPTPASKRPARPTKPHTKLHKLLTDKSFDPAQLLPTLMAEHALVTKENVDFALSRERKLPARTRAYFELLVAIGAQHAKALWTVFTWCRRGAGPGHRLDHAYRQHELPKKSGGTRTISAPHRTLRYLQTRIYQEILASLPIHAAAQGFVPGRSILDNAAVHVGQPIVTNVDVANCFPNVRWPLVLGALRRHLASKMSPMAISMLCDICTAFGALPIGAPTSPTLLNLILLRTDEVLSQAADAKGCRYTRYADDLTFSGDHGAVEMLGVARRTLSQIGLKLDDKKTQIYRRGRRQMVTGLVVNQQVSIPRRLRRRLRAAAHHTQLGKPSHWHTIDNALNEEQLQGLLSYLKMVHPNEAARLAAKASKRPKAQDGTPQLPDQAP